MTYGADMIITRGGTVLPLDQRRRDALANYAELHAREAGVPVQTWVMKTWPLKLYEAKDLIKGNASEPVFERLLKLRGHEHGGWRLALPVLGAVIGEELSEFLSDEKGRLRDERQLMEENEHQLGAMVVDLSACLGLGRRRSGVIPYRARRADVRERR